MLVKSLLFIIILIYIYESYKKCLILYKKYQDTKTKNLFKVKENFNNLNNELKENYKNYSDSFLILPKYNNKKDKLNKKCNDIFLQESVNEDSDFSSKYQWNYDDSLKYYYNLKNSVNEGRRLEKIRINKLNELKKKLNDSSLSINDKNKIENEIKINQWKSYIFKKENDKNVERDRADIITDYDPNLIGCVRPYMNCTSNIQDLSY